ncbi:MAG: DUF2357 domain-containing protein, partial [Lentisphaeria bacterium]|nr:DUF2357 domain-containing protein [Lentisphaeria bacterium]
VTDFSDQTAEWKVDARNDLRVVCPCEEVPWYRTRSNKLPVLSFPFYDKGRTLISYSLPTPCKEKQEADFKTVLGISSKNCNLIQENTIRRFSDESADDAIETEVNSWINWSVRLFQEIAGDQSVEYGDSFSGLNRCSWSLVAEYVTGEGGQEALMSLIVQLSEKNQLKNALKSISRNPRKILERIRENMKVSRIQQMDGACIREYARRPGYDTATKAGPKQELLAVQRVEKTDTLENRLYVWVLKAIEDLARKYVRENISFSYSQRVGNVRKFGTEAAFMRKSPALESVSTDELIHPVQPNYPLQLDRRYKEIYEAYNKLRHNQKVMDDAWEWQRVLWHCTARVQFYSFLMESKILQRKYSSFLYVKNESQQGCYLEKSNAPGPFQYTGRKKEMCYLIDSWDITSPEEFLGSEEIFPGAHSLGRIGCDAVFYCSGRRKVMLIWYAYGTDSSLQHRKEQIKSCQNAMKAFIEELIQKNKILSRIEGLIITTAFQRKKNSSHILVSNTKEMPVVRLLELQNKKEFTPEMHDAVQKIFEEFLA